MIIINSQDDGSLHVGAAEGTATIMMNGERVVIPKNQHLVIEPMVKRHLTKAGKLVVVLATLACVAFTWGWLIPTYWGWLDR